MKSERTALGLFQGLVLGWIIGMWIADWRIRLSLAALCIGTGLGGYWLTRRAPGGEAKP